MSLYESIPCWIMETPDHVKTQEMCNEAMSINSLSLQYVPDHLKTQEMCERAIEENPYILQFVPDCFKTHEMCKKVVEEYPWWLKDIPDHFKTQEMCKKAVEEYPWQLDNVPDHFKTQEMCEKAVRRRPWLVEYVPDHLKTKEMYERAVENTPCTLEFVPDKCKMKEMCERAAGDYPWALEFVPDHLSSSKPEEFNFKDIEVLIDSEEHNWFKRAHVGKFLGLACIITSTVRLPEEDIKSWAFPQAEVGICSMDPCREDVQDHDIFISLTGTLYVIVNSQKDKGKMLREHILKDIVPPGFDARIEEIQRKHQQAIKEKDAALALLGDDLQDHENHIQAIQYENVALQAQRHVYQTQLQKCQDTIICLKTCYVDHARDSSKENTIIIVWKHTGPANDKFHDLPNYVARIQQRKRYVKLRWFD